MENIFNMGENDHSNTVFNFYSNFIEVSSLSHYRMPIYEKYSLALKIYNHISNFPESCINKKSMLARLELFLDGVIEYMRCNLYNTKDNLSNIIGIEKILNSDENAQFPTIFDDYIVLKNETNITLYHDNRIDKTYLCSFDTIYRARKLEKLTDLDKLFIVYTATADFENAKTHKIIFV